MGYLKVSDLVHSLLDTFASNGVHVYLFFNNIKCKQGLFSHWKETALPCGICSVSTFYLFSFHDMKRGLRVLCCYSNTFSSHVPHRILDQCFWIIQDPGSKTELTEGCAGHSFLDTPTLYSVVYQLGAKLPPLQIHACMYTTHAGASALMMFYCCCSYYL